MVPCQNLNKFFGGKMSTSTVVTVLVGFLGTGGTTIAAFLKKAEKDAANINALVVRYEAMANSVLKEITKIENQISALTPASAPAQAKTTRAPKKSEKNPEPKKRLR